MIENNRDRVLKAYCAARLSGVVSEAGVAPAGDAARAVVVGRVKPDRFVAWCREAEVMCQEEFWSRQFRLKEENAISKELIRLHRENPWHGEQWADGVDALIREYGKPRIDRAWIETLEYLREQRR